MRRAPAPRGRLASVRRTRNRLFFLVLLLAACGGGSSGEPFLPPDPETAPDVVLLTVSGRYLDPLDLFCPPECNQAYLGDAGDAAEAIFTELTNAGLTVEVENYIAAWNNYASPDRLGCHQLIEDLKRIDALWPESRIVLVGHSHGCVWAHNVVAAVPDIEIDILVSIDGVSTQWEDDHADSLTAFYDDEGGNPFAFDLRDVTAAWTTAAGTRDTKDVAFDNVVLNVEVQSDDAFVKDTVDNVRMDGTAAGITRLASTMDNHSAVHQPGTESMNFVIDEIVTALLAP